MRLTIIGCSGSFAGPNSPASSYLVQSEHEGRTWNLVLDMGPGSLGALQRHIELDAIDAIVISHLHPDHCLDLTAWDVAAAHSSTAPWRPVVTHAPAGARDRIVRAAAVTEDEEVKLDRSFDFRTINQGSRLTIGCFTLTFARVAHPVESYAIRIEGPHGALVYSGDTGPTLALDDLAHEARLLLAEASFPDRAGLPADLHLSGRQAGECAAAAGVEILVITHVPAWEDPDARVREARTSFDGRVVLAEPGLVIRW